MINVFIDRSPRIRKGLIRRLARECYKDGQAAGNTEGWHGFESFMRVGTQLTADALQSLSTGTYAGLPVDFAGLSNGSLDRLEGYKCFTPVIVNTARDTGGGPVAWKDGADTYLRLMISEGSYGVGDEMSLILLTKEAYRDLKDLLDDKEYIWVDRGVSGPSEVAVGFKKLNFDGVAIMEDVAIPTTDAEGATVYGYGMDCDKIGLNVLNEKKKSTIFSVEVQWDQDYQADKIYFCHFGNLTFRSPRHFGKLADLVI